MNTKNVEDQIKKSEREGFIKLKEEENKNKNFPISDDILYISDFTLEKFDKLGDSGNLYLAINKYNSNEKYILKHECYHCACNEYIYSKIGNKMGVKIAPVKLFVLDDKKSKFKSDFVCGIKYLENCEHVNFDYIMKNKNSINNWQDYFRMRCLESLFEEGDGIEVVKYKNEIYRLDTTASFILSDFYIYPLAYDYDNNGINIREFANKNILRIAKRNPELRIDNWKYNIEFFSEKLGKEYLNYYLETFNLLEKITEEDIDEWTNILTLFYPNIIGEYFKIYFNNLKLDVKQFLSEVNDKYLIAI